MTLSTYDRAASVEYAHRWAYSRNPRYYDFEKIGGDCTNFASQCLFAGAKVMNYTHTFGWYYRDAKDRAPAWSGVPYFYNFMTRSKAGPGPVMRLCALSDLQPGDFIQLRFRPDEFSHTPVVVSVGERPSPDNLLLAAHSFDADNRPLSSYQYEEARFLHVLGVRRG